MESASTYSTIWSWNALRSCPHQCKETKLFSVLLHAKPVWTRLISKILCLITPNVGELIIAEQFSTSGSPCNTIVLGRN